MKRTFAAAIVVALLATPSFAGGGYGYHSWDEGPPWGCSAPGACRLPGPGAYGYYGANGNGYVPRRPRRLVPVEPFACHNPMFVPSAGRWVCPPVNVVPQ